jgi:N-acetylmuramic acid 6-phosphate etherase
MNVTESSSNHDNLEEMSINELLNHINQEDQTVAKAVQKVIPQVEALVKEIIPRMEIGGRIFYIGAGTSGRLGILDASECPPTYGVEQGMVVGLIAGGDGAIRIAVENAEDDQDQAWKDLDEHLINHKDTVIGIAASGRTPYVIGGIKKAKEHGILTGCITCNPDSALAWEAEYPIEPIVGPEFVTGSTRMKAGTAQKLVLNMISTSVMIQLGRVKGNRMIDMQLSNNKLVDRGTKMVMEMLQVDYPTANGLLTKHGSVRAVIKAIKNS